MRDIEFFAKIKPKRLTSLAEDFKESQAAFRRDQLSNELRRSGKLNQVLLETSYERFPEES
jgi:hypothetical protein